MSWIEQGKIRGHSTGDDMRPLQLIDAVTRFTATAVGVLRARLVSMLFAVGLVLVLPLLIFRVVTVVPRYVDGMRARACGHERRVSYRLMSWRNVAW